MQTTKGFAFFLFLNVKANPYLFPLVQLIVLALLFVFQWTNSQLELSLIINSWHQPWLDQLCLYGTFLGDGTLIVLICFIVYFYKPELAVGMLFAYLISSGITQGLKHTIFAEFHRPLWHINQLNLQDYYLPIGAEHNLANSFPSGHTTSAFAYFCILSLYFKQHYLKIGMLILAFFVAFTRVYLLQHFVMDITVGSIIGTSVSLWVYYGLYQNGKLKWAIIKTKS